MNTHQIYYRVIALLIVSALTLSCTEEIDLGDELKFEDVIVIEGTLTNEVRFQRVLLSRTYEFDASGPIPERNAQVSVSVNGTDMISFTEQSPGVYVSEDEFAAKSDTDYRLIVKTNDGRSYESPNVQLTNETAIGEVFAKREINSLGTEILTINVDSYDPTGQSNYYRYEYEETYKIIAPNWVPQDFLLVEDENGNISPYPDFTPRPVEEKECYNTVPSNSIIQTSTTDLSEDRVSAFPVRSISTDDPVISHRYSILVRQYVQSLEAFTYYDVLNQLSGSGNVLSQIQPGFVPSNMISLQSRDEKVLGFFEVASVSEKRIFFNYEDLFPGEPLPPYFIECATSTPLPIRPGLPPATPLKDQIEAGIIKYFEDNDGAPSNEGPYKVVATPCGDCTQLGSSEAPDFWIE